MLSFFSSSRLLVALIFFAMVSACQIQTPKPDDPSFAPVMTDIYPEIKGRNGSLFVAQESLELYQDKRARRVGDMIMVQLSETTSSSKDSKADIKKSDNITLVNPNILNAAPSFGLPKGLPLSSHKNLDLSAKVNNNNNFSGESKIDQNNSLSGLITVMVDRVLPNGSLSIRGEKWITLNQGAEYIRLTGIIRSEDINSDNTIESKRIADARITYSGTGMPNDANQRGWLARFFTSPYMPL